MVAAATCARETATGTVTVTVTGLAPEIEVEGGGGAIERGAHRGGEGVDATAALRRCAGAVVRLTAMFGGETLEKG